MNMVDPVLLEKMQQLDDAEKIKLAQALLSSVHPDALPVTREEAALVEERMADLRANPDDRMTSEDVWEHIHNKFG